MCKVFDQYLRVWMYMILACGVAAAIAEGWICGENEKYCDESTLPGPVIFSLGAAMAAPFVGITMAVKYISHIIHNINM